MSKIGSPNIKIGTANVITADILSIPCTDIQAKINPKNSAPVSPINIFAGLKLYGKNPNPAPATAAVKMATLRLSLIKVNASNAIEDIEETPTAKPSNPSSKFTALHIPTIQNIVTTHETQ